MLSLAVSSCAVTYCAALCRIVLCLAALLVSSTLCTCVYVRAHSSSRLQSMIRVRLTAHVDFAIGAHARRDRHDDMRIVRVLQQQFLQEFENALFQQLVGFYEIGKTS